MNGVAVLLAVLSAVLSAVLAAYAYSLSKIREDDKEKIKALITFYPGVRVRVRRFDPGLTKYADCTGKIEGAVYGGTMFSLILDLKDGSKVSEVISFHKALEYLEVLPEESKMKTEKKAEIMDALLDNLKTVSRCLTSEDCRKNSRISKRDYYLGIARAVSMRSTCIRRQYGAVIVRDDAIIATGYNGSARGEANCCDCGSCAREAQGVPHGERYELCVAVHAEANAIMQAGRAARGATLYLWGGENGRAIKAVPCMMCERLIKNAGIAEVICGEEEE